MQQQSQANTTSGSGVGVDVNGDNVILGQPIDPSNVDLSGINLAAGTDGAGASDNSMMVATNGPTKGLFAPSSADAGPNSPADLLAYGNKLSAELAGQMRVANSEMAQIRTGDALDLANLEAQNSQGMFAGALASSAPSNAPWYDRLGSAIAGAASDVYDNPSAFFRVLVKAP